MTEEQKSQSWWQTVPGILTATAGTITAVTGLIVALHQAGVFNMRPAHNNTSTQIEATKPASTPGAVENSTTSTSVGQPGQYSFTLPEGTKVRLGSATYQILAAQLDGYNAEQQTLRFTVRVTNNGDYPINFWDDTFRLFVDGVPRAPVGGLNKLVYGQSTEEGEVEFVIPGAAQLVELIVRHSDESTQIPIDLSAKPMVSDKK